MAGAGAGPYSHLHFGMMLKHFKSGRCGVALGWGDRNGDPYLHLYFADREPADKNDKDRSKCYEWLRLSVSVPMDEPLVEERVLNPCNDSEDDEHDAKKVAEDVTPLAGDERDVELVMLVDYDKSLANDDFIVVDETPKEKMKIERMKNKRIKNEKMVRKLDTIMEGSFIIMRKIDAITEESFIVHHDSI